MSQPWIPSLISVAIVSLISLIGILSVAMKERKEQDSNLLRLLVSLAIGALLGDLLIHLFPEIYNEIGPRSVFYVVGGFIVFFVLEKVLHWKHQHDQTDKSRIEPFGIMNLIADGVHNLIDGALVAASYFVSFPVGLATTIAVIAHEIPQELGDYGILRLAGFSKKSALFFNFLSALLAILGAVVVLILGSGINNYVSLVLAFTSGGFIYLIFLLIRKLEDEMAFRHAFSTVCLILVGIGLMWGITFLE